ncbi:MAG: ABC-type transport auxiliary lipoprotein family protein [Kiloniellales bacterium]
MTTRRRLLAALLAVPLAALTAACELPVPGQGPPPMLYRLTPKSTFGEDLPRVRWQLIIEVPVADAGLNTTRLALQRAPTQLEYYARSSWTDRAPVMVQTLMIESFENSQRIIAVGRESVGLRADFILKTELREFQAEYYSGAKPKVRVRINAKMVRMPRRAIIGSQSFEAVAEAGADNMTDIIAAFDEALGKSIKHLVEWTLKIGQWAVGE